MNERVGSMTATRGAGTVARVPRHVSLFSGVLERLLRAGVPIGPNGLITIRGRKTGLPRTVAVAFVESDGRRWIWSPWGEVNWARNLRAAGEAWITVHGRKEDVTATELDPTERVRFFRDVLGAYARAMRGGFTFVRLVDGVDLHDPVAAADGRVVFELHPGTAA
jgi:deazaflavin-dependent oxidoreductase (nitroreductase family)